MEQLEDDSLMPWGIHKGKKMEKVPAAYLLWLYDNKKCGEGNVKDYIIDNLDVLEKEKKERENFQ